MSQNIKKGIFLFVFPKKWNNFVNRKMKLMLMHSNIIISSLIILWRNLG